MIPNFAALMSAFLMAIVNHFVLHQPNPDMDKLVALLVVSFHACQTVIHSVEQIVALGHKWLATKEK